MVFACGGGIYTSAVEAAVKYDGKVIGVDVDQNYIGEQGVEDGKYSYNPFVTSAMKGLSEGVTDALEHVAAGSWDTIAGTNFVYGLQEGDYVGLPTAEAAGTSPPSLWKSMRLCWKRSAAAKSLLTTTLTTPPSLPPASM